MRPFWSLGIKFQSQLNIVDYTATNNVTKPQNVSCNCQVRLACGLGELVCIQISQEKPFCMISLHIHEAVMSVV